MSANANLSDFVQGKCTTMCPEAEILMREHERLLHVLEMVPGTEKHRYPKADRERIVKQFARSAAGKTIHESELRPANVLIQTVSYLLFDVIDVKFLKWHVIYDFITDRLMSVRQDMVVQNLSTIETIAILQPIIRFHAYAAYRLCCENVSNFDPVLNNKHLQECLKKLLCAYDSYSFSYTQFQPIYLTETRPEFEAIYVVLNLGSDEALQRAVGLPKEFKTELVVRVLRLAFVYRNGNYVQSARIMQTLPSLLVALASLHLQKLRKTALLTMSTAYNSKTLPFPLSKLQEILLYGTSEELREDCRHYGLNCDQENVFFRKELFNHNKTINMRYHSFVEDKFLKHNLQEILLKS